ncbi:hypothetical protein KDL44_03020 [bacterium]|nr:hypothetical protein [bacterium]
MDFYNFFSFSAKKAIFRASEICAQFNNQYLQPEHIFYSIVNLRSSTAVQVMHELNVNLPKLTYSLEAHLYEHSQDYKGSASFSTRTLALLDLAFKEVKRLHHDEIGTSHLLIALSQERSQFLRDLFEEHNIDHKKIREMYSMFLRGERPSRDGSKLSSSAKSGSSRGLTAHLRISDLVMSAYCQKIFARAAYICFNSGSAHIEPLHLFYGMLRMLNCSAYRILTELGYDSEGTLASLQELLQELPTESVSQQGMSDTCLQLLDRAQELQHQLRQRELLTAHILLEMIREPSPDLQVLLGDSKLVFRDALKAFLHYLLDDQYMKPE